jgi:Uncharacterised nucleotidyltransferase
VVQIDAARRDAWLVQEHSLKVLKRLVLACDREGIDLLPVKGILSARTLYADVSERVISDIDVRVRPRDVRRVERLARGEGWTVIHRMHAYSNLVLAIDGRDVDVEAHMGPPGVCTITVDTLIARATREDRTFGFSALVMDPHDHALLLVLNAFKDHMATAMAWAIDDLSKVVRAPWFDTATLVERAESGQVRTVLWIVADWMARFMADEVWEAVRDRMGGPSRTAFTSAHLWFESIGGPGQFPLRVLSRFASDAHRQWPHALGRTLAWQIEAWFSQLGQTPWKRGVTFPPKPRTRT